jgi:hypothetical protein
MKPEHTIHRYRFQPEPGADYAFDIMIRASDTEPPLLKLRRHLAAVIAEINEGEAEQGAKLSAVKK